MHSEYKNKTRSYIRLSVIRIILEKQEDHCDFKDGIAPYTARIYHCSDGRRECEHVPYNA